MWFYLETNSLISLRSKLELISNNTYTSYYSILELLKGVNAEKYQRQYILANKIKDSKILFDWDSTEKKRMSSFSVFNHISSNTVYIQQIFNTLCEESCYNDFITKLKEKKIEKDFIFLNNHDLFENDLRLNIALPLIKKIKDISKSDSREEINKFINDKNYLLNFGINNLVTFYSQLYKIDPDLLYKRYNNKLDIFLICSAAYHFNKIKNIEQFGKNDISDLSHLLYLQNKSTIIVTNDNFLLKIVKTYFPKNACNTKQFINFLTFKN